MKLRKKRVTKPDAESPYPNRLIHPTVSPDTAEELAILSRLKGDDKYEVVCGKDIIFVTAMYHPHGGDYVIARTKEKEYRFPPILAHNILLSWIHSHNFLTTRAKKYPHLSVISPEAEEARQLYGVGSIWVKVEE